MKTPTVFENKINHIALIIDASGSMRTREQEVIKVIDNQITYLAKRSQELDQETRVTVYQFSDRTNINCLIYDKDVLRLPSIASQYRTNGQTALIRAQLQAMEDLLQTPEKYGDHAFLLYAITDGGENDSGIKPEVLRKAIDDLPENYTVAVLVPDQQCVYEAKGAGYPASNIAVWNTNHGFDEVGSIIRESTETFMSNRSRGVRGTKSLFKVVNVDVSRSTVIRTLRELTPLQFKIYPITHDDEIRYYVELVTHNAYVKGTAFYELTKTEEVQAYKKLAIRDRATNNVYVGPEARQLLGIPNTFAKLKPGDFKNFQVFVESTSVNRKLVSGTDLLVVQPAVIESLNRI